MSDLPGALDMGSLKKIVGRRRRPALLAFAILVTIFVIVALFLPSVFKSEAIVLIEQQEIPQDLVRSTVTSYADQRVQMMFQKAMTFSNLSNIIKKYDLYPDVREDKPLELVVEKMREDIDHNMISADVVDPRSGRPVEATIAFSIAYYSEKPELAQKVANEIVSLLLEENLRNRTEMAEQAASFLGDELAKLKKESEEYETRLAAFKERNFRSLPEQTALNMSMLDRSEKERDSLRTQIQNLQERKVYLASQLTQIEPYDRAIGDSREAIMTTESRIRFLQNRYLSLISTYSSTHPDVVRTRRELEQLISSGMSSLPVEVVEKQLQILNAELDKLRIRYSSEHPDVKRKVAEIEKYNETLSTLKKAGITPRSEDADNPAYVQISTTLHTTDIELENLNHNLALLESKVSEYTTALEKAPQVEKEYREIERDYQNTSTKYQEIKAKYLEAKMSRALEKERKGEKFTLIEPPLLPEKPVKPNRIVIASLGIILSIGLSLGLIWVLEIVDGGIRTSTDVSNFYGEPPLVLVPYISTNQEHNVRRRFYVMTATSALAVMIVMFALVHVFVMPIDVIWFAAMRKIG